ncbi:hypothetical protein [Bacillus sp. MRMR6]|uniref:hypothetical protein n=1 Tax=Bacillus sp. MRMR6 TaxID=1928617 RepID=UPI000950EF0F|nr:hypothetical protein [Bacillus sp. MRMR6]OLS41014.1 hypothetical protein BTR25_06730 [Bacillus sp. MRMR6]
MRRVWAAVVFLCVLLLAGCFGGPVQDDILSYVNDELSTARELEVQAITSYEGVSGANYQDDPTMYDALVNAVIPNYTEFIKELEAVTIETAELEEIHKLYIKGAKLQYDGFLKIVDALEKQDANLIQEANKLLNEGRETINDYNAKMKELTKEHNVNLEER